MPCLLRPLTLLLYGVLVLGVAEAKPPMPVPEAFPTGRQVRLANLHVSDTDWQQLAAPLQDLLRDLAPDMVILHSVISDTSSGPPACRMARPLKMQCDFVSADPPSQRLRQGTALMSARPLVADGLTLLHGGPETAPVAAGFQRLDVDGVPVDVYVASLAPGIANRSGRQRQAGDLRQWMASQASELPLVVANFASGGKELSSLMPGWRASRARNAASGDRSHGLDVLYLPGCRLLETRSLTVLEPGTGNEVAIGLLVRLQLPERPRTPEAATPDPLSRS